MNTASRFSRRSFLQRSAAAAVLVAGSGAAFPAIRSAMAQNGDYQLVCISDGVRVRQSASLSGAILGSVNTGDVVNVTGQTVYADGYGWLPVTVQGSGLAGYVADAFFQRPDGSSGWVRGTPVHVASDNVNMRSGAGLGYSIVGNVNTGTNGVVNEGPLVADGYSWYHVTVDNLTGYMAADFLSEGHTGNPGPGSQFRVGAYVRPTSSLNLRSGPGTGNGVIRVIGSDEVATIIDGPQSSGGYAWYQVEMWDGAGTIGWVAGDFLQIARFEPTGSRHRIFDGPLNMRQWGSLSAPVITALSTGTIVVIADASFVSADGYTWMNVYVETDPSLRGWIAQGFSQEV